MKKLLFVTAILILSLNLTAQVRKKAEYKFLVDHSEIKPAAVHSKADLSKWKKELAAGKITADDYQTLLLGDSDIAKMNGDATYWDHIRNKAFLTLIKQDTTISGTVIKVYNEADGDLHVKMSIASGTIDAEIICYIAANNTFCKGYKNTFTRPKVGDKITVTGDYVLDRHHKWYEIHPVKKLE